MKPRQGLNPVGVKKQCFDTGLASGRVELTNEQKKNIFDFITTKLKTEQNERTTILLQFGKERFERALNVN
jgi:hypothetical protein